MAWADIYRDKQGDIPETVPDSASYLEEPDIPLDIPPMFRLDLATAKSADAYVRYMAKSKR